MRDKLGRFIKGSQIGKATQIKKGEHFSAKTEFKKGELIDEKHPYWKGENAGYWGKHRWIYKKYGKANHCSFNPTHVATRYEWANVSGSYLRDIDDYTQLCPKCHHQYDVIRRGYTRKDRKGVVRLWDFA